MSSGILVPAFMVDCSLFLSPSHGDHNKLFIQATLIAYINIQFLRFCCFCEASSAYSGSEMQMYASNLEGCELAIGYIVDLGLT